MVTETARPTPSQKDTMEKLNNALALKQPPPYIKFSASEPPPTPQFTTSLFNLCDEQKFALNVLTDLLLKEGDAMKSGVLLPQQLIKILGHAGTGKSEIIKAYLWHAFQHGLISDLIAVTSYTWKAALLIGTDHNPGYTSCTFYGTTHKKSRSK
ncbi:hypothetical protein CEUSTIGMA_g13242.t1 [Chlamydomonas eustigma]|uniref:DNA helicase n=1 Tax=Chlamydomonas eustigma TaxID=1157962 RepID=A0A250XRW4_9CHLO|nr:hypothetical protein CEUSTIGMA_g13242.t1 [Chlamydomonas eustigma]|eukprot:GAX85827.1 hypothetical protein CEUSTIGMA_g13242.t1 [Chlamydomonas eustigma]